MALDSPSHGTCNACRQLHTFSPADLSTLLWALAVLGHAGASQLIVPLLQLTSTWSAADFTAHVRIHSLPCVANMSADHLSLQPGANSVRGRLCLS